MDKNEKRSFPLENIIGREVKPGNAIFIGNFGSEESWHEDETFKIPYIVDISAKRIFRYCDELELYLASEDDVVILRQTLDIDFKKYLRKAGIRLPHLEIVSFEREDYTLTQIILEDKDLLDRLTKRVKRANSKGEDIYIVPYCVSHKEVELALKIGAKILPVDSDICSYLNNKIVVRKIASKINCSLPKGMICNGIDELRVAYAEFFKTDETVVIKELFGIGGKGLVIIRNKEEFNVFCDILAKNPLNSSNKILIEKWYDVLYSLNCQFLISDKIYPYVCSQQVLDNGIFVGSHIPAESVISYQEADKHMEQTYKICGIIQETGYRGVVGIDTITTNKNEYFYAIDINARFNTSTFFNAAKYLIGSPTAVIGRWFEFKYVDSISFIELLQIFGEGIYDRNTKKGYFILNFSTLNVNSKFQSSKLKKGKVFVLIAGDDDKAVKKQCEKLSARVINYNRALN